MMIAGIRCFRLFSLTNHNELNAKDQLYNQKDTAGLTNRKTTKEMNQRRLGNIICINRINISLWYQRRNLQY